MSLLTKMAAPPGRGKVEAHERLLEAALAARRPKGGERTIAAAALTRNGRVYTGVNLRLSDQWEHAEQMALGNAVTNGEREILALLVLGGDREGKLGATPPCGNCLQAIYELSSRTDVIFGVPGQMQVYPITDLLTHPWGWSGTPWSSPLPTIHSPDPLVEAAFAARSNAYVPRYRFPVGAAVETTNGRLFMGARVEISSFPTQAERLAIANALAADETEIGRIAIVGGNDPARGDPPSISWDSLQIMATHAPFATVLLPTPLGGIVSHSVRELVNSLGTA